MTSIHNNYQFNNRSNTNNNVSSTSNTGSNGGGGGGSSNVSNSAKQQISLRGRTESPATSHHHHHQRKFNTTGQVATMISRLPAAVSGNSNNVLQQQRQSNNNSKTSTLTNGGSSSGGTPPSSADYLNSNSYITSKTNLNPTIRRSSFKSIIADTESSQQLNKLKSHVQQQSLSKQQSEPPPSLLNPTSSTNKSNKYTNLYSNLNHATSTTTPSSSSSLSNKDNISESFYLLNLNKAYSSTNSSNSAKNNNSNQMNMILNNNDSVSNRSNQTSTRQAGVKLSIVTQQQQQQQQQRNGSANNNENDYRFQQTQQTQFQPQSSIYIQESTPFYSPTATNITSSSSSSSYKSSNQMPSSSSLSSSSSTKYNNNNDNNAHHNELESKGMVGLKNLGNTCFMNSILQCLSNTKCLLEYCITNSYTDDINTTLSVMKGSLFNAYASLIKTMWKSDSIVSPQDFKSQIARFAPRFVGYAQQDAEEFLYYLLKGLHEDVNLVRKKPSPFRFDEKAWDRMNDAEKSQEHWEINLRTDKSRISDMFVGQLKSTLKCTKCDYKSPTYELFWHLALPIPAKSTSIKLEDCLRLFMSEEILDGDNKPLCSRCNEKRRCTKRYTIEKLPKILVIHLKRFSKIRYNNKINLNVDYPIDSLDMSKFLSDNIELITSNSIRNNCIYDLYGISLHSGTESSGHYVAYCKHPYKKRWYCYNDSQVREINQSALQDSDAYILFYQLRN